MRFRISAFLLPLLLLLSYSALATTITQSMSCTVTDSQGNVVSNTCTASDGSTLVFQGQLDGVATPTLFQIESAPVIAYHNHDLATPYYFTFSESLTITGQFELIGGTGPAYIKTGGFNACCLSNQMVEMTANATISGPINDPNLDLCDPGPCNKTFGPILFGQPFQETLTATVSGFAPPSGFDGTLYGNIYAASIISITGIVDSNGNPIPGAQLIEIPEPKDLVVDLLAIIGLIFSARRYRDPSST